MKRTIVHTSKYKTELANFMQSMPVFNKIQDGTTLAWEVSAADNFAQALMLLLHKLAMSENPVYRHSPKLRDLADSLFNTDVHTKAVTELKAFIKSNKELNIEGYVTFRMEAYHTQLDMLLYTIMKKINLSKH